MPTTATSPILQIKLASAIAEGEFTAIAATWEIDRTGDRFQRGAFLASIADWRARGALPPLLWGHDTGEPIGAIIDAQETDRGLEIVGRLAIGTVNGRRAYELLKAGSGALATSVGFFPTEFRPERGITVITKVDWVELSLTPVPAQQGAVILDVKTMFPDRKTFEHAARNALGLSRSQAKRLAADGWSGLSRDDKDDEPDASTAAMDAALLRIANLNR